MLYFYRFRGRSEVYGPSGLAYILIQLPTAQAREQCMVLPCHGQDLESIAAAPDCWPWKPFSAVLEASYRLTPRRSNWSLLGSTNSSVPPILLVTSGILAALIMILPVNYYFTVVKGYQLEIRGPRSGQFFVVILLGGTVALGLVLYGISYGVWRLIVRLFRRTSKEGDNLP